MSSTTRCISLAITGWLLAVALGAAAPPQGFIDVEGGRLHVTAGEPAALTLALPGGESWAEASLPRLQVRTFGRSWTVPVIDPANVTLTVDEPGLAMVILSAGPAGVKDLRNAVELTPFCAKLMIRVEPSRGDTPTTGEQAPLKSPDLTSKTGQAIEIRPYFEPSRLNPHRSGGAVLPVRAYFQGVAQAGATITAHGPDGTRQVVKTDRDGFTRVSVDRAGRWLLRFQHATRDGVSTGELIFEVEPSSEEAAR